MILAVEQLFFKRKPHHFFVGDKRNESFKKEKQEARLKVISAFMLPFPYRRALDGAKGQRDKGNIASY